MGVTMKLKTREGMAGNLLDARGWISCWLSGNEFPDNKVWVRAGNLQAAVQEIDKVLKKLGHKGNGRCH